MAYVDKIIWAGNTADDLSSAADHTEVFHAGSNRIKVHEVGATITTVLNGAATVKFDKTNDTSRGDGDAGVVTIPTTTAVNKVVKDTTSTIFPFVMGPGEFLTPQVTSAATSGGCLYYVKYEIIEETAANVSDISESA